MKLTFTNIVAIALLFATTRTKLKEWFPLLAENAAIPAIAISERCSTAAPDVEREAFDSSSACAGVVVFASSSLLGGNPGRFTLAARDDALICTGIALPTRLDSLGPTMAASGSLGS